MGSSGSSARDASFRPTRPPLAAAALTIVQAPRLVSSALGAAVVGAEPGAARQLLAFSTPGVDGLDLTLPAWSQ